MRRRDFLKASGFLIPLFVFALLVQQVHAATTYTKSLDIGNIWTQSGTYDDSLVEQGYTNNEIMNDTSDNSIMFHDFQVNASLDSTATVTVSFWNIQLSGGSYINGTPTLLGSETLSSSQIGTEVPVPSAYTNANGISIDATETASSGSGWFYLHETWGDATSYSSNGEVLYDTPSYATSTSTPPTTTPITSVTGAGTVNVYSVETPPDWSAIEQGTADDIINDIPPVDSPPSGSNAITVSSQLSITPPAAQQSISTPVINNVPSAPPETGATNFDFTDSGDTSAIAVPTTDSKPFSISDPMAGMTYSTSIPVPGSAPDASMVPVSPGGSTPVPNISVPVASSGPAYVGSTALLGSVPLPSGAASAGGGPTPSVASPASTGTPSPTPGGSTSLPQFSFGVGSSPTPLYNYSP